MKSHIASLTILAAFLGLFMMPSAYAEPAPAEYSVSDCGTISWSYTAHRGARDYRQQWLDALKEISTMSGITFIEKEDAAIVLKWGRPIGSEQNSIGSATTFYDGRAIYHTDIIMWNFLPRLFGPSKNLYRITERKIVRAMIHELGHALGLGHSVSNGNLMSTYFPGTPITKDDVAAFAAVKRVCNE